ncbi:MAG: hydrogen gas-evolving membrane-bound hydrogenase subunit E, partial [Pseudomonadota bacterium]
PAILAALGALFGVFPDLLQVSLVNPTVASLTGSVAEAKELKLWAGVNMPLILSVATFALGLVFYFAHRPLRRGLARFFDAAPSLDLGWDRFLDGLKALAAWQTGIIQTGRLSSYLFVTFATIAAGLVATLFLAAPLPLALDFGDLTWKHATLAALIAGGSALVTITGSRTAAIASLGVVGIGAALVFIVFSAPDVAITQLLVETLVVVLVSVVMLRLPLLPPARFRAGHAAVSVVVGGAVAAILLAVLATPLDRRLTDYFEASSWPEAYGRNIVNVILVDFRALDTFGEIAVVVVAALSAYALLRTTKRGAP